jgi:hypothetical protein
MTSNKKAPCESEGLFIYKYASYYLLCLLRNIIGVHVVSNQGSCNVAMRSDHVCICIVELVDAVLIPTEVATQKVNMVHAGAAGFVILAKSFIQPVEAIYFIFFFFPECSRSEGMNSSAWYTSV